MKVQLRVPWGKTELQKLDFWNLCFKCPIFERYSKPMDRCNYKHRYTSKRYGILYVRARNSGSATYTGCGESMFGVDWGRQIHLTSGHMQKQCTYQKNDFAQRNYWNSFALCGLNQRYMLDHYSFETAEYSPHDEPKNYIPEGNGSFAKLTRSLQLCSRVLTRQLYRSPQMEWSNNDTDYDNCASWRIKCSVFIECQKPDFDCPCNTILNILAISRKAAPILSLLLTLWTTIGIRLKSSWVHLKVYGIIYGRRAVLKGYTICIERYLDWVPEQNYNEIYGEAEEHCAVSILACNNYTKLQRN